MTSPERTKKASPIVSPRATPQRLPPEYEALSVQIGKAVQALGMAIDYLNSARTGVLQMARERMQEQENLEKVEQKFMEKQKKE